ARAPTSISATLFEYELVDGRAPLLRKRRSARLVQRELENAETEDRALEADGSERDAELVEQRFLRHRCDLTGRLSLHEIAQHRGRRLADRAASAVEADLLDHVAVAEPDRDQDLVSTERVLTLRERIGRVEQPVVPRVLVVIEDELPIQLVELGHGYPSEDLALWRPSTRRSTSSGIE